MGLKTLLSDFNIPYLNKRISLEYAIYTDSEGEKFLLQSDIFVCLNKIVDVDIIQIKDLKYDSKFDLCTRCYNNIIEKSSSGNIAFIFINADMMVSSNFFEFLYEKVLSGIRCIQIDGIRVIKSNIIDALGARDSKILSINSRELCRIALNNIHPIMLNHIRQESSPIGDSPFHTYWKCNNYGYMGMISHYHPIYLYPTNTDCKSLNTTDWDLVDNSGLEWSEIYHLNDSDIAISIEASDLDYVLSPAYPADSNIFRMRALLKISYSHYNKKCLSLPVYLRSQSGGDIWWFITRIRSSIWYMAICKSSNLFALLEFLIYYGLRLNYHICNNFTSIVALYKALISRKNMSPEKIFDSISGFSFKPYQQLYNNNPILFKASFSNLVMYFIFIKQLMINYEHEYDELFYEERLKIAPARSIKLNLNSDPFIGSQWEKVQGSPFLSTSRFGKSSIYVSLYPDIAYDVKLNVFAMETYKLFNLRIILNDNLNIVYRFKNEGSLVIFFTIPTMFLKKNKGKVKISFEFKDLIGITPGKIYIHSLTMTPCGSLQSAVLKSNFLAEDLYAHYSLLNNDFNILYNDLNYELASENISVNKWIDRMDQFIANNSFEFSSQSIETNKINLSGPIFGSGWGDRAKIGTKFYRYLGNKGSSKIFLKYNLTNKSACKIYFTNYNESIRNLIVLINNYKPEKISIRYDREGYYIYAEVINGFSQNHDNQVIIEIRNNPSHKSPLDLTIKQKMLLAAKKLLFRPRYVSQAMIPFSTLVFA